MRERRKYLPLGARRRKRRQRQGFFRLCKTRVFLQPLLLLLLVFLVRWRVGRGRKRRRKGGIRRLLVRLVEEGKGRKGKET